MMKSAQKAQPDELNNKIELSDDDSIVIQVEPQKKAFTHTEFDIKYEEDERMLEIYIELDPKNISNLIKESNKNKTFTDERKIYPNCIFLKKIECPFSKVKGNFRINYLHYKGFTFIVEFRVAKEVEHNEDAQGLLGMFAKMKIHFEAIDKWEVKWVNSESVDSKSSVYEFEVAAVDVEKILKEKLLIEILCDKNQPKKSKGYAGLINIGNTCYANSTLQVLFNFLPLRKIIVEIPEKKLGKLTRALQNIFVELTAAKGSVDPEELLKAIQVVDDFRKQQDIHEFLIGFFAELEAEVPEVSEFWTGKDFEKTFSKDFEYSTKQEQNFTELQLMMADEKGNNFSCINESLKHLLEEDKADEPIDTSEFGKISVFKARHFCRMPTFLFLNIKRYEYNAKRKELKKINLDLSYPDEINLDFLMKTPEGLDYVLYSVVVHKGRSPNSGHYFCFINVSKNVLEPIWYEFNDTIVRKVPTNKVLKNYTGKKKTVIQLTKEYGKWEEREEPSEETAYLLTYIRKDLFEEYQNVEITLSSWHLKRLQEKLTEEEARTMVSVKLQVYRNDEEFKPLEQSGDMLEVKLQKDQTIESEIKKNENVLCCSVGTIWKVNCKTGTIKYISKNYGDECQVTVSRHVEFKRGMRMPDYFLIIPSEFMKEEYANMKLGILHIEIITEDSKTEKVEILPKSQVFELFVEIKKNGDNIEYSKEELEYFMHDWNDYLRISQSVSS